MFFEDADKSPLIENRIINYLWDSFSDSAKETVLSNYCGGSWDALSSALTIAALQKLYVPEEMLKEAEEAAMEFIDFGNGKWAYFVLDPIEDIRANNAKLISEGKVPPDIDGEVSVSK